MEIFNQFDLFGTQLTFRVLGRERYHSIISLTLTVMILLASVLFTYFFGLDFIFHKESKILQSVRTNQEYEFRKFTMNDFFFAWRIEGIYGNEINFTHLLYPTIGHYSYKTGESVLLKYEKCRNFNITFDISNDIKDFYCSDISDYSIGGAFDNDNKYEYLYLNIDICEGTHCPSKKDVMNLLNTYEGIYVMIYYPTISYDPEEKIPYKITFNKLSVFLGAELVTINRFYIRKYIFEDDNGWMFPKLNKKELFGVSEVVTYNVLNDLGDDDQIPLNSYIYTGNFYFERNYSYNKRWFTKAFESLSIISAFYKTLFVIFGWLSSLCNKFLLYQIIISKTNNNPKKSIKVKSKKTESQNISSINNLNKNEFSKINLQLLNKNVKVTPYNKNNKGLFSVADKTKNKNSFSFMRLKVTKTVDLDHNGMRENDNVCPLHYNKKIYTKNSFYRSLFLYLFHCFLKKDKKIDYEIDSMNRRIFFKKIDVERYLNLLVKFDEVYDYIKNTKSPINDLTDSFFERNNNIT